MFRLRFIPHATLKENDLDEIIRIKSIAWPYDKKQQVRWMDLHLNQPDIHVLLIDQEKAVAYLNLIKISLALDDKQVTAYGIGNVCTIDKGRGFGKELMLRTNSYLSQNGLMGLLFCKSSLADFYLARFWSILDKRQLVAKFNADQFLTMFYNSPSEFTKLEFSGTPF